MMTSLLFIVPSRVSSGNIYKLLLLLLLQATSKAKHLLMASPTAARH
jgi:hypothetical protein